MGRGSGHLGSRRAGLGNKTLVVRCLKAYHVGERLPCLSLAVRDKISPWGGCKPEEDQTSGHHRKEPCENRAGAKMPGTQPGESGLAGLPGTLLTSSATSGEPSWAPGLSSTPGPGLGAHPVWQSSCLIGLLLKNLS